LAPAWFVTIAWALADHHWLKLAEVQPLLILDELQLTATKP
jgi:hypothetical protein